LKIFSNRIDLKETLTCLLDREKLILTSDEVKKKIIKLYNENPKDWHMLVGLDSKGYHDLLVVHGSEFWYIKEQTINPYHTVGFGTQGKIEDNILPKISSNFTYGLRPLTHGQAAMLFEALQKGKNVGNILQKLLSVQPAPTSQLKSPMILQGPIIQATKPLSFLSEDQRKLDLELRKRLEKLLYEKYSHILTQYV
jgi:hypothetical protein